MTRVAGALAVVLLACNAPSKDGLFSRAGAAGALGSSGAGGSDNGTGTGGSDSGQGGTSGQGLGGTDDPGQGGEGAGGATIDVDAGADAADAAPQAEPDAAPVCSGTLVDELCWHLGEPGDSCVDTCEGLGGYDERATPIIGSEDQGGSLEQYTTLLEALLGEAADTNDDNDSSGVGCHLRGDDQDRVWIENTDFAPDASEDEVRIACACVG